MPYLAKEFKDTRMKYTLFVIAIFTAMVSCGPSAEEVKKHEEKRNEILDQADDEWEKEMEEMEDEEANSSDNQPDTDSE